MADLRCPFQSGYDAQVFKSVECIQEACKVWDDTNDQCGANNSAAFIHWHKQHLHDYGHTCASGFNSTNCGSNALNNLISKSAILIQEFMFNEDLDGNGKTYGFDFKIKNTDTNKPPILIDIEQNPNWSDTRICCQITWAQFLAWDADSDDSPYRTGGPCASC